MKKQKFTHKSPKLKKVSIAKLNSVKGANPQQDMEETLKTFCCSKIPYCEFTLTTRPDSLNPNNRAETTRAETTLD